jgi:hypothetical protein
MHQITNSDEYLNNSIEKISLKLEQLNSMQKEQQFNNMKVQSLI